MFFFLELKHLRHLGMHKLQTAASRLLKFGPYVDKSLERKCANLQNFPITR